MDSNFGVYVHIPFCIQRCHYCDFATYSKDQISPNQDYVHSLIHEIKIRRPLIPHSKLKTIYFGGGTPSLLEPRQIGEIITALKEEGFFFDQNIEVTLEVNPATLDKDKCLGFIDAGVNRVSIGCQTFDNQLLKACNREHSAEQTLLTIELVKKYFTNYSLDLLFSLPKQDPLQLQNDIETMCRFDPPHISAYCLTLPQGHAMNRGRCDEETQIQMFETIFSAFHAKNLARYEISNFAKAGFESQHNLLYWTDQSYWGVGLSAHSYLREPQWGVRFWNPSTYQGYTSTISSLNRNSSFDQSYAKKQVERLQQHESLSDYCHTHLRLKIGLNKNSLRHKFGDSCLKIVEQRIEILINQDLVKKDKDSWVLTDRGVLLSNRVFESLLFLGSDIDNN